MLVEASLYIFIHFGLMYCFLNLHDAEYPYTLFFVKKYENKLGPAFFIHGQVITSEVEQFF